MLCDWNLGLYNINLLKTKRNLLYIGNQSAPRCNHSPTQLKNCFMQGISPYRAVNSFHFVNKTQSVNDVYSKDRLLSVLIYVQNT
jgi:hypothetical protein